MEVVEINITKEAKNRLVERAVGHRDAKHLAKGVVSIQDGRGEQRIDYNLEDEDDRPAMCAVGCFATPLKSEGLTEMPYYEDVDTAYYEIESEFGVPNKLSKIADAIFECLEPTLAKNWPHKFASSLPVGSAEIEIPDTEEFNSVYQKRHEFIAWDEDGEPEAKKAANQFLYALKNAESL